MRKKLATWMLNVGRKAGRALGCELVVEPSSHSLEISMEPPNKTQRAWDPNLYKRGAIFPADYGNPVKIVVDHNPELSEPDTADVKDGDVDVVDGDADAKLISSARYQIFMIQNVIEQLLTPGEKWEQVVYALLILGGLQALTLGLAIAEVL